MNQHKRYIMINPEDIMSVMEVNIVKHISFGEVMKTVNVSPLIKKEESSLK